VPNGTEDQEHRADDRQQEPDDPQHLDTEDEAQHEADDSEDQHDLDGSLSGLDADNDREVLVDGLSLMHRNGF
jgi:hypothetical protein